MDKLLYYNVKIKQYKFLYRKISCNIVIGTTTADSIVLKAIG